MPVKPPGLVNRVYDPVNAPAHYDAGDPLEVINVIEHYRLGFHLGNVVKYVLRAEKKGSKLQDLQKAEWYLNRAIANTKKETVPLGLFQCGRTDCRTKFIPLEDAVGEKLQCPDCGSTVVTRVDREE